MVQIDTSIDHRGFSMCWTRFWGKKRQKMAGSRTAGALNEHDYSFLQVFTSLHGFFLIDRSKLIIVTSMSHEYGVVMIIWLSQTKNYMVELSLGPRIEHNWQIIDFWPLWAPFFNISQLHLGKAGKYVMYSPHNHVFMVSGCQKWRFWPIKL